MKKSIHFRKLTLLLVLLTSGAVLFAQELTVSGKVTDKESGQPLEGVSVAIKSSSKGTTTNSNGEFILKVPSASSVLVFSFVGKTRQEIPVGADLNFNVTLAADNSTLDDVVVVGYGTQRRGKVLGAINSMKATEFEELPITNLGAALVGRVPGLSVSGGFSRPGSNATLTIRNPVILSKDGGTLSPLYVIDDVIRTEEDFNLLDPSEIEDISIIKDAAAAIYGVRSSQGAIVIRTKRGKIGKTQISFNSSYAINNATQLPDMMTGYELAKYLNASTMARRNFVADGSTGYLADAAYYTDDELEYFKNNNYNWLKQAWKPSHLSRHTVNVSGGSDRATFFAGASYVKQDGNLDRISIEKWTFRASTDVKLTNGFKVGLAVSGDLGRREQYLLKQGGENPENDMKGLLYTPGFTPPYIAGFPVRLSQATNQNTIDAFHFFEAQRLNNYNNEDNNGLNIIGNVEYQVPFVKGLTAKVQYSKTLDNSYPKQYGTTYKLYKFEMTGEHDHIYTENVLLNNTSPITASNGNRIYIKPSFNNSYQFNASLGYTGRFRKHDISAIVVVEQSEYKYNDVQTVVETPTPGAPDDGRFAFGEEDIFETEKEGGLVGYIGRVSYSYDNKYLAEFQGRLDASTKFAPENHWKPFYSVAVGWVISNENFFDKMSRTVDHLKLRLSMGKMGSDNTKDYGYIQRYTPLQNGGAVFGGNGNLSIGTRPEAIPNPDVRWDDNLKLNGGIDARFLKNRLSSSLDVFYDHRYNMLTALTASVPILIGSAIASENFSTVNAYGFEFSTGWRDNINKDFTYNINTFFNWSDAKNVKVDVEKGKVGTYEDPTGKSTDMGVQGYHYLGMFRTQADVDNWLSKNPGYTLFGQAPKPGMLYYQDIRGPKDPLTNKYAAPDGKIDGNDLDFITNKASNHWGFGLSLGAGWKGLKLDIVMSGSFGGQSTVEGAARKLGTATSSRPAFWTDVWTPENTNAEYPNPFYSSSYDVTSAFWFKSSFNFRMRTANLSYAIPAAFTKKMGFSNLRLYVSAVNPVNFFNPYSYKDNASGSFDAYPNLRTVLFGVNASL
ncbi:MAG TPA: SusC/RagA family TonB-linked outer membrane protein [Chitinophagaceae bacterium]|nr:SusC/RagA family TonB-linked outer membrane protein [Chitinophagaceae bacterium]